MWIFRAIATSAREQSRGRLRQLFGVDRSADDFDVPDWSFTVDFELLEGVKHVHAFDDFPESGVLAIEVRRGAEHQEERSGGGIGIVAARHGNDAAVVFHVVAELALQGVDPADAGTKRDRDGT